MSVQARQVDSKCRFCGRTCPYYGYSKKVKYGKLSTPPTAYPQGGFYAGRPCPFPRTALLPPRDFSDPPPNGNTLPYPANDPVLPQHAFLLRTQVSEHLTDWKNMRILPPVFPGTSPDHVQPGVLPSL